ncbi:hypothetical protein F5148DRAFT_1151454 [Russula earlei]|uniref:Uncharacterized protein n=1 Tax=Russula earlei TaxID=71964 RepID=A0ACC0U111_9AGAM|nr:hypothetical protein F5148DRAFT_1151454 [Russula earlei]
MTSVRASSESGVDDGRERYDKRVGSMKQTKILVVQGMDVDEGARGVGEVGGNQAEVSSLFLGIEWAMQGNDIERSVREVSEKRERNDDSWRDDRRGREMRDKGKGRHVGKGREGGGGKCKSCSDTLQDCLEEVLHTVREFEDAGVPWHLMDPPFFGWSTS